MQAAEAEVAVLTREALTALLAARRGVDQGQSMRCRRKVARWPFPGTVQLWLPDDDFGERLELARSLNLSEEGLAVRCEEPIAPGIEITLAVHEPEISFQGRAIVRHCTENDDGRYCVGMSFVFEDE